MTAIKPPTLLPFVGIAFLGLGLIFLIVSIIKAIKLLVLLALAGTVVLIVGGIFLMARKFMR
jgi:hypothetical protein